MATTGGEPIGFKRANGEMANGEQEGRTSGPSIRYSPLAIRPVWPESFIFGRFLGLFALTHGFLRL
jgi:hypothetical protein